MTGSRSYLGNCTLASMNLFFV